MRAIDERPEELIQAENFINEGSLDAALKILNDFEEYKERPLPELVSCHLLKCELFYQQGLYNDTVKLAEQTYKESLSLGKSFLSVDALIMMTEALIFLYEIEKAFSRIRQGEELSKSLARDLSLDYQHRKASIDYLKGRIYTLVLKFDLAIEHLKHSLVLREKLGAKQGVAVTLMQLGWVLGIHKGELNRALAYLKQGLTIFKESNSMRYYFAECLNKLAAIYASKGEIDHGIKYYEQSLTIFKELNNKARLATVLNNIGDAYREKGELDRALECLEESLALCNELGIPKRIAGTYDFLIQILIEKDDLEKAQQYLHSEEQIKNKLNDKNLDLQYRLNEAMLLKTSLRARNRVKAEDILKQILEDEVLIHEFATRALLNLCELLLIELRMTKDLEVLEEVECYIARLIDSAEKSNSFWILGETYLLQAKLALISLDLKKARQLLTQGQQIAEKNGLNLLAEKISNEHDNVINQLNMWENMKKSESSLEERIDLAGLDEQISSTVRKKIVKPEEFEIEQSVLLAIISKEGNIIFSNPFTADMMFDVNRMADLLSSFNILSDDIFRESLDRVKFLDFTLLMNEVNSFIICYMFKGRTYSAHQKLSHFCDALKSNIDIVEILNSSVKKTKPMTMSDIPLIEELISDSFLSDPQQFQVPFKAYEGEEPYLFVSYTHVDKLHVYPIIDYLNKMGINIWYDEGIPVSENWKKSIAENLERCNTFLVFISPQILNSEMVKKEISFALKKKKKFVAVYLKETKLPIELEFEIADIQALMKYHMKEPEFYTKLREVLKFLPNK